METHVHSTYDKITGYLNLLFDYLVDSCSHCSLKFTCWEPTRFGINCSFPNNKCDMNQSCQNDGTCINSDDNLNQICSCMSGLDGKYCEIDRRVCKENTCWNNGTHFFSY